MTALNSPEQHPILVTAIPNARAFEITDPLTGNSSLIDVNPRHEVSELAARLVVINELASHGTQSVDELRVIYQDQQLRSDEPPLIKPWALGKAIGLLGKILPPEVISLTGSFDKPTEVTVGNIAVASRMASEEEAEQIRQGFFEATKAELEALECLKADLGVYAHAIITADGQRYILEMLSPMALLSARVIQEMQAYQRGDIVTAVDIARDVWKAMPLGERAMFESNPDKLYAPTKPALAKQVEEIIKLTGRLGITQRHPAPSKAVIRKPNHAVEYGVMPLTEPDVTLRPIYPPKTEQQYIASRLANLAPEPEVDDRPPEPAELEYAEHAVQDLVNVRGLVHLDHEQAIELMDFIMDRRGKKALEHVIEQTDNSRPLDKGLQRLHAIAKSALGYTQYQIAFRNRTIAGHHPTGAYGNMTFLTGAMPSINSAARTTTRWYVGDSFAPPIPKEEI